MTDRISREMLIEYLTHAVTGRSGLGQAAGIESLSLADAIAADVAFDDAIAAAIEREAGESNS